MEQTSVMSEEAWSSLNGMYASKEDSELLTQLLSGFSSPNELSGIWSPGQETGSLVCSSEFCHSNECLVSQETSPDDGQSVLYHDGTFFHSDDGQSVLYHDATFFHSDDISEGYKSPMVIPGPGDFGDNEMERSDFARKSALYLLPVGEPIMKSYSLGGMSDQCDMRIFEKQNLNLDRPRQGDLPMKNAPESKKRSRNVTDVTRSKRNLKSDKYQKVVASGKATENDDSTKTNYVSHSTEEHSSITQEVTKGETHTTKTSKASSGRGKVGKGASSDPQSLYARKRRERINERLRILQSLVPNGTKVDISTMLEEAVRYVKFLQLQIKLLSSNETWMYAPLAYNGMDIGISNFDITTNTSPR